MSIVSHNLTRVLNSAANSKSEFHADYFELSVCFQTLHVFYNTVWGVVCPPLSFGFIFS